MLQVVFSIWFIMKSKLFAYAIWMRARKKISTEKMWNLKRIHAPITIFRHTLELNVEIYFLILNSLFQLYPLKAHREHSYGLWANKFIPPFISSMWYQALKLVFSLFSAEMLKLYANKSLNYIFMLSHAVISAAKKTTHSTLSFSNYE